MLPFKCLRLLRHIVEWHLRCLTAWRHVGHLAVRGAIRTRRRARDILEVQFLGRKFFKLSPMIFSFCRECGGEIFLPLISSGSRCCVLALLLALHSECRLVHMHRRYCKGVKALRCLLCGELAGVEDRGGWVTKAAILIGVTTSDQWSMAVKAKIVQPQHRRLVVFEMETGGIRGCASHALHHWHRLPLRVDVVWNRESSWSCGLDRLLKAILVEPEIAVDGAAALGGFCPVLLGGV